MLLVSPRKKVHTYIFNSFFISFQEAATLFFCNDKAHNLLAWKLKGIVYLKVEPELLNMDSYLDIETILLPKHWLFRSIHAVFTQTSGCSNMLVVLKCTQTLRSVSMKWKVFSLLSWRLLFKLLHATTLELSKGCKITSEEKKKSFSYKTDRQRNWSFL